MGAVVEVFSGVVARPVRVFTDARGHYDAAGLQAGTYYIKVSAPSFLPSLRENVMLKSGTSLVVNLTLNTLFEALQMIPQRRSTQEDDDWKWTLRSAANRPILRVLDDGPMIVTASESRDDQTLKARVAFVAGSDADGFGNTGDMSTRFAIEHSLFSTGRLAFAGNVGSDANQGVLRASYSHRLPNGSTPEIALTVRRFATLNAPSHLLAAQALSLTSSDTMTLADRLELRFGSEFQTLQFLGRASAIRPFGSADFHLTPDTVVEYQYATTVPSTRFSKGFDTSPADLTESDPRMTIARAEPAIERARHQEISLSHRLGNTSVQLAAYSDHVAIPP
jgi:hypothetical protein